MDRKEVSQNNEAHEKKKVLLAMQAVIRVGEDAVNNDRLRNSQ